MKLKLYTTSGKAEGSVEAASDIFGVKVSNTLLAQAVRVQCANRRAAIANTKDRSEVSGGGRKPWRQKGTGRARAGSNRSPIWRGGGVTFGPSNNRNFAMQLPAKMRMLARHMALSQKAKDNTIYTVKSLEKTDRKSLQALLTTLKLSDKKVLLVTNSDQQALQRTARNLTPINTIGVNSLNTYDIMNSDAIMWPQDILKAVK